MRLLVDTHTAPEIMLFFVWSTSAKTKGYTAINHQTRREKRTTSLFAHVASCHPYPCSCFFISSFLPCHFPWFLPGWSPEKPPQTPSSIKLSHDFSRIFRKKVFPPPNPSNPSGCNIPQIPPKSHPARDPDICEVDRAPPKFNKDTIRYPVFVPLSRQSCRGDFPRPWATRTSYEKSPPGEAKVACFMGCEMVGIYLDEWLMFYGINVGKYAINGSYMGFIWVYICIPSLKVTHLTHGCPKKMDSPFSKRVFT